MQAAGAGLRHPEIRMKRLKLPRCLLSLLAVAALGLVGVAQAQEANDGYIAATIKAALLDNRNTSGTRINVDSRDGVVQLSGFASSEAEKAAATRVASGVSGVKQVVNNVAIAAPTSMGTKLDDSLLTGKVKAALMDAADVSSLQINVETRGGVTQLAGYVPTAAMKEKAGRIAAGIEGVRSVDNVLVIKPR
jgi:hyperosmotically inducible periplasmic protein